MNNTNDWTILHDLGLVYLFLAFNTDEDLSDNEKEWLAGLGKNMDLYRCY